MAKVDDVSARVGVIEIWVKIGGSLATIILLGWLCWLSHIVYGIAGDVRAMKQADKDHGVEIVSQIAKPTSAEQQQLALISTGANLTKASLSKTKPDPAKLSSLSSALLSSANTADAPIEVWKVAAKLISYRSDATFDFHVDSKPPCFSLPLVNGPRLGQPGHFRYDGVGCSIDLNDLGTYERSKVFASAKQNTPAGNVFVYLNLVGANVILDPSRPIIPIVVLTCDLCAFSIKAADSLSPEGKTLIRTLLAEDKPLVALPLSPSGASPKEALRSDGRHLAEPRAAMATITYIL